MAYAQRVKLANLILIVSLSAVTACSAPAGANPYSAAFPDPERFAGDMAAFAAADSAAFPVPGGVLCIGSSSMRMWHPTIVRDLAPLPVIPRGFGGSTIYDVLHFARQVVLPYRPAAILLYEGDNDIDFGVSPADFMAAFEDFTDLVWRELPSTRIYVISIKPSGLRWAKWPAMQEANGLLTAACDTDDRLTYIDVATPLLNQAGRPDHRLFLPDRLHLNADGYTVWSQAIASVVVPAETSD